MNSMCRVGLGSVLLACAALTAAGQEKALPRYLDIAAAEHAGEAAIVTGKVIAVTKSKNGTTYLNFGDRFPRQIFSAVVLTRDEAAVGDVKQFEGKAVTVTGKIELSPDKKPQIVLRAPGQVAVVAEAGAAGDTDSPAMPADAKKDGATPGSPAPGSPATPPAAAPAAPAAAQKQPSAPARKIALAAGWDSPAQSGEMTRKDLATVFAGHGKASDGAAGDAAIRVYADIPYLAPLAEAKKRLKLEGMTSTKTKVTCPGLPIGSFSSNSFSGVFEGGYNRLCLITDLADQLVSVQFVEDTPRQRSKEVTDLFGFHTYNFVSARTKGTDNLIIKHEIVEGTPGVVVVESILVNPNDPENAPPAKSTSRSSGSSSKSRKPRTGDVMEMSRWLVPAPVVQLILRCAEGR